MRYFIVSVGDDPDDGICQGPFASASDALRNMTDSDISFYVLHSPVDWVGPDIRGWHANISSIYIIGTSKEKPTWEEDIRPVLLKVRSGEIKRQYDEE